MFKVDDRVEIVLDGSLVGKLGTVHSVDPTDGEVFYLVDVDGYSDTTWARLLNAVAGLDHGYVPLLEEDLNLVN